MSCFVLFVVYLYVSGSGSITSVGEERANVSAVCNNVVSVRRGFLFLWVLGMGYFTGLFYCGTPLTFHIIILVISEIWYWLSYMKLLVIAYFYFWCQEMSNYTSP